jgi:hypothetical protein
VPATYRIDRSLKTIFSAGTGVVTDADLRDHQRTVLADPEFDPRFDQIWDLQQVEDVDVSNEALRSLAESRSYSSESKRAIVAPRDVVYGMARMFEMLHEEAPETFRVFRTDREARAWLGLS